MADQLLLRVEKYNSRSSGVLFFLHLVSNFLSFLLIKVSSCVYHFSDDLLYSLLALLISGLDAAFITVFQFVIVLLRLFPISSWGTIVSRNSSDINGQKRGPWYDLAW